MSIQPIGEGGSSRVLQLLVSSALTVALAVPGSAQVPGTVRTTQKLASTAPAFPGQLDDQDRFGRSASRLSDLDGDGVDELVVGAIGDDDGGSDRGAVWVLFQGSDGMVASTQKISSTQGGFAGALANGDQFGSAVASLGDLNGDGNDDLAVGAAGDDTGGANKGAVWILFLAADGTVLSETKIASGTGGFTGNVSKGDGFGVSLANLGDLDGDGTVDLAVGADRDDGGGANRGGVWILFLATDGRVSGQAWIGSGGGGFSGLLDDGDRFGISLAHPGPGAGNPAMLAVGALGDDDGGPNRGAVWILFLDATGSVTGHRKLGQGSGVPLMNGDGFGSSVAFPGDVDDDGTGDLAVGALFDDDGGPDRGAVHVLFLRQDGTMRAGGVKISSTSGSFQGTLVDDDRFGSSIAALGDLDQDGFEDIAVGAYHDDTGGADRGATWVTILRGCPVSVVNLRKGSGINRMILTAPDPPGFNGNWDVFLDCTGHLPNLAIHLGMLSPHPGLEIKAGEILVDFGSPRIFINQFQHTGGMQQITYPIPTDLSWCAFFVYSQAVVFGDPGPELSNALDFRTGR
jgi:hypothetical protein